MRRSRRRKSPARGASRREPRSGLVADAMLGSLARKARAFGLDTVYYSEGGDAGILRISRMQGRTIVTADRALAARADAAGLPALLLSGSTDGRLLSSMASEARRRGIRIEAGEPRCSLCNGKLLAVTREHAAGALPRPVAERHRSFYQCSACGKLYWRGSHWKKLRRLERRFRAGL